MAAVTPTRNGDGVASLSVAYSATSSLRPQSYNGDPLYICYAQLTGAMTINATVTNLKQFQEIVFLFSTDGTERIVTFGTNFVSSGTLTIPASKDAVVRAVFDGTNIRINSREIQA